MMTNVIKVLFVLVKKRVNVSNKCAIKCRVTYSKERKEFATGLFINPINWHKKLQQVVPPEPDHDFINIQLSLIKTKINKAFLFLQVNELDFNVQDIYTHYKGEPLKKDYGVMEVYKLHSARIKKLIGIDIKEVTYQKYLESGVHLQGFIKHKYNAKDTHLKALKSAFIDQYEYYLKTEKRLQQSTLNKAIQRFRKVIKYALSEDYLIKDPFILYRAKRVKKPVLFLSHKELKRLEEKTFIIARVQKIKDMFVFCCYTGLGFKEMSQLQKKDITREFDGELWLTINRQKTGRIYKLPLLPKAKAIMEKYDDVSSDYVMPSISNAGFNAYLKEIADIVGLEINLTHHIARKTFASTVLLYNDVPMEIVSELLGHSNMAITQAHYGKVVQNKVSEEMKRLHRKLA
ncbi:MAG: site-specific integrase [Flavobacteriales bacterium]|nr:site-specific integrase [Flavobacteriales bacterium]